MPTNDTCCNKAASEVFFKQQAEVMNALKIMALARGIDIEFDLTDPLRPIANFITGNDSQMAKLARDIEEEFGRITA